MLTKSEERNVIEVAIRMTDFFSFLLFHKRKTHFHLHSSYVAFEAYSSKERKATASIQLWQYD